jgi:hypothetical protein
MDRLMQVKRQKPEEVEVRSKRLRIIEDSDDDD